MFSLLRSIKLNKQPILILIKTHLYILLSYYFIPHYLMRKLFIPKQVSGKIIDHLNLPVSFMLNIFTVCFNCTFGANFFSLDFYPLSYLKDKSWKSSIRTEGKALQRIYQKHSQTNCMQNGLSQRNIGHIRSKEMLDFQ